MGSRIPKEGRCGAKLAGRKPTEYCERYPLVGKNRCKRHGGASVPAGPGHHRYKHGRYSKELPKEFQTRIGKILADGDLRKIAKDLALTQVLLDDAVADYASADNPEAEAKAGDRIIKLQETRDALLSGEVRRYTQMRDTMRLSEVMTMLGSMAASVRSKSQKWAEDGKMQDVEGFLAAVDDEFRRVRAGGGRPMALTVKAEGVTA